MQIREGQPRDISSLVSLDFVSYGEYGEDEEYFQKKFQTEKARIIVSERGGKITGFVVIEIMEPGQHPDNFSDFSLAQPITENGYI